MENRDINGYGYNIKRLDVSGELNIPELPDITTPPINPNAIGVFNNVMYKWNSDTSIWDELSISRSTITIGFEDALMASTDVTRTYLNTMYPDVGIGSYI